MWCWSRRACVRHTWWRTKRSWPLFSPTFFSSFFFFSAFYFSPTSGNLPCKKICSPQYFGITRRYMHFRNGQHSVTAACFSFFFFSVYCFWPTLGNLLCAKICFPQYFGITRRYMQSKIGQFLFFYEKKEVIFERFFLLFTASIGSRPPGPPAVPGVFSNIFISINWTNL